MQRVLLAARVRLTFGGVPRSFAMLRVAPTAAATARFVARPPALSLRRYLEFTPLRALSAVATPIALAADRSDVAPKCAAELRTLTVDQVVNFVKGLHVSQAQADKLAKQEVDGAALLETSLDELCDRCGLSAGAAHAIMRGIAPAVTESQSVTLTIYPPRPKNKGSNVTQEETLTPAEFLRMFDVLKAPLRIATDSGLVQGVAKTLAQAAAAEKKGLRLLASRRYDDDLTALNGFKTNCSTALEMKSTRALAADINLIRSYGSLELVNSGEVVKLRLSRLGKEALELAPDGLVVSTSSSLILFNSAKHTPTEDDIDQLLNDAKKLKRILFDFANVSTTPPAAKEQLAKLLPAVFGMSKSASPRDLLRIVPFLSGDNFSAFVAAECEQMGVGIVRPSGEGFVVKAVKPAD